MICSITCSDKPCFSVSCLSAHGVSNGTEDVPFIYQQIVKVEMDAGPSTKTAVAVLTSLFFCFVNCVMLFALKSNMFHSVRSFS